MRQISIYLTKRLNALFLFSVNHSLKNEVEWMFCLRTEEMDLTPSRQSTDEPNSPLISIRGRSGLHSVYIFLSSF